MSLLKFLAPYCKSLDPDGEARCWKRGRFVGGRCPRCWDLLLGSNDPTVLGELAAEDDIPDEALLALAETRWAPVGVEIARRESSLPAGVMTRLVEHPEAIVRMEAAKRPDLSPQMADRMLELSTHDTGVRKVIAGYAKLSPAASNALLNDEEFDVHAALAHNRSADPEDLRVLASSHPQPEVRAAAEATLSALTAA